MKFVKTDDLKAGMRLAKPIYNRNGVLLYDRNSSLTFPAINSIKNFGLIGIFILEPAEPVPPLSREDIEFEQCQTIYLFQLRELMDHITKRQPIDDVDRLVEDLLQHYGTLDHRVNFNQNLRSSEDFMYKHAISTAILVAMITSRLGYTRQRQSVLVTAALLYDYGYRNVPKGILDKGSDLTESDKDTIPLPL
jgi:HD-GYP domain-containing protein (c-di-GMP phosphodiesterase class II)